MIKKALVFAVSMALASTSTGWADTSTIKPNKKPFPLLPGGTGGRLSTGVIGTGRRIATDGQGNYLAIWVEFKTLYGQYTRNGERVGDNFIIRKNDGYGLDHRLSVAMSANGNAVACWRELNNKRRATSNNSATLCQLIPASTSEDITTEPIMVDANSRTYDAAFSIWNSGPSVAMDSNGEFIVAWSNQDWGVDGSVYARHYQANGTAKEESKLMVAGPDLYFDKGMAVALDPDGNGAGMGGDAIVVWSTDSPESYNRVYMRRIHNDGGLGSAIQVGLTDDYSSGIKDFIYDYFSPDVAMNGSGSFVVAWQYEKSMSIVSKDIDDFVEDGIFAQRFDANDSPLNSNKKTGALEDMRIFKAPPKFFELNPKVMTDSAGNFIVGWEKTTDSWCPDDRCYPTSKAVYFKRYDAASNKFGGNKSAKFGKFSSSPSIAMDDEGNFEVMWTGTQRSSYYGVSYWVDTPMARFYPGKKK